MSLDLKIKLGSDFPVLSDMMQCRERRTLIRGPRGSAKTFSIAQRCLLHMAEQEPNDRGLRPTRGLVCRFSYRELEATVIKDFMDVFKDLGTLRGGMTPTWTCHPGLYLDDGSQLQAEVVFQSTGVDDVESTIKGHQITYAWFNELSGQPKLGWDTADAGLGRYPSKVSGGVPCTGRYLIGDTNSFDEAHWLFPLMSNPPPGFAVFHQPGAVVWTGKVGPDGRKVWAYNPAAECYVPDPERFYMELISGKSDDWIKVLIANEYGFHVDGLPVAPWYVDSVHCASEEFEPDPALPIILGLDFGRTPAAAFAQRQASGRWIFFDELTSENMSASVFAPELKRKLDARYPGFAVTGWGDPAGDRSGQTVETTPIDIVRNHGIPVQPAPSNVLALRAAALANPALQNCMDARPRLLLSPRAKMLRKACMGGYSFRKLRIAGATDTYSSERDKTSPFGHIFEAAEYACLGGGEGSAALRPASHLHIERRWPEHQYSEMSWGDS